LPTMLDDTFLEVHKATRGGAFYGKFDCDCVHIIHTVGPITFCLHTMITEC